MTKSTHILIIEDDAMHTKTIRDGISGRWLDRSFTFHTVTNELEFKRRFEEYASLPIDLAIIDQMIPYTTRDDQEDHEEAKGLSSFRGGSRCYVQLKNDPRTEAAPKIFFTILNQESVPPEAESLARCGRHVGIRPE